MSSDVTRVRNVENLLRGLDARDDKPVPEIEADRVAREWIRGRTSR